MTSGTDFDQRFDKVDEQLDKITKALIKGFDRIDNALEDKADKKDVKQILDIIDYFSKRLEISEQERLVMGHQIDRLDGWVHELAKKIGHDLAV